MGSGGMGLLGLDTGLGSLVLAMVAIVVAAWIAVRLGFRAPDE